MQGNLLWVYEGQTSFWDLVLAARSGMQSKEMVLAEWATHAGYYSVQPGREWRPVEDTPLDPVIAEIGRASCREEGCQYVLLSVVAVALINKSTRVKLERHTPTLT